jgi:hypothetical protein
MKKTEYDSVLLTSRVWHIVSAELIKNQTIDSIKMAALTRLGEDWRDYDSGCPLCEYYRGCNNGYCAACILPPCAEGLHTDYDVAANTRKPLQIRRLAAAKVAGACDKWLMENPVVVSKKPEQYDFGLGDKVIAPDGTIWTIVAIADHYAPGPAYQVIPLSRNRGRYSGHLVGTIPEVSDKLNKDGYKPWDGTITFIPKGERHE